MRTSSFCHLCSFRCRDTKNDPSRALCATAACNEPCEPACMKSPGALKSTNGKASSRNALPNSSASSLSHRKAPLPRSERRTCASPDSLKTQVKEALTEALAHKRHKAASHKCHRSTFSQRRAQCASCAASWLCPCAMPATRKHDVMRYLRCASWFRNWLHKASQICTCRRVSCKLVTAWKPEGLPPSIYTLHRRCTLIFFFKR